LAKFRDSKLLGNSTSRLMNPRLLEALIQLMLQDITKSNTNLTF